MKYLNFQCKDEYIKFNSQSTRYKTPYGAVSCGCDVKIQIQIDKRVLLKDLFFCLIEDEDEKPNSKITKKNKMTLDKDREDSSNDFNSYFYTFKTSEEAKLLFYYFEINLKDNTTFFYGNNEYGLGGIGKTYKKDPIFYQITTYFKENKTPDWFKESIIYQIFPDRFYNGNDNGSINSPKKNSFIYGDWNDIPMYIKNEKNEILRWDFYGGNLKGIEKKINYIKDLGANLIYLNPIFKARSNHRYDTGDYKEIDEILGTEEDFKNLVKKAKENGINIMLDGVFNHTGRDSKYFNRYLNYDTIGAYNSKDSPYYDWYKFEKYPDEYECWWGVKDLPSVNENVPSFIDYIINSKDSVINYWMNLGVKGWRLDVADELPSEFLAKIRKKCHENDEKSVILGEVWEDATNKISYNKRRSYVRGKELDSVTNYSFKEIFLGYFSNKFNTSKLIMLFENMKENYPKENFYALTNIIGSHDVERILTMCIGVSDYIRKEIYKNEFDREEIDKNNLSKIIGDRILKLIVTMQMVFPGVPLIYYGDEVGVEGDKDPDNRRTFPWGNENKEIQEMYKNLIKLRKSSKMFSIGEFKQINFTEDVYGVIRTYKEDYSLIILNRHPLKFYELELKDIEGEELFNYESKEKIKKDNGVFKIKIRPLSAMIYTK